MKVFWWIWIIICNEFSLIYSEEHCACNKLKRVIFGKLSRRDVCFAVELFTILTQPVTKNMILIKAGRYKIDHRIRLSHS